MRFRDRFIKFMYGRYGVDELGKHLLVLAIALSALGLFLPRIPSFVCSVLSLALTGLIFYRALSKNINRRVMENHRYLAKTEKIRAWARFCKKRWSERKTYRYLRCPHCKGYCRVPKGKGKIKVTCRVCKKQFERKV